MNYKLWLTASALILSIPSAALAQDEDEIKLHYVKGDTLAFYADAYVLPEGANLDRLLRKLPGVTYYSSGNVEIDGITVKEITVDTKYFFKNTIDSTYQYSQRLFTRPVDYTDYYAKIGYIWLTRHALTTLQYQYKRIDKTRD